MDEVGVSRAPARVKKQALAFVPPLLRFAEFRSHHDLRFFEKRVNTSVCCMQQDKKSVQKVQTML